MECNYMKHRIKNKIYLTVSDNSMATNAHTFIFNEMKKAK